MMNLFWKLVHKRYGNTKRGYLNVPVGYLSDPDTNYLLYNTEGLVVAGTRTLREAINTAKIRGWYLAKLHKYSR